MKKEKKTTRQKWCSRRCRYRRGNSARSMNNVRTTPTPKVTQTTIIPRYRCLFINRSADWVKPFPRAPVFPREEQRVGAKAALSFGNGVTKSTRLSFDREFEARTLRHGNTGSKISISPRIETDIANSLTKHETRTPLHEIRRLVNPIIACRSRAPGFVKRPRSGTRSITTSDIHNIKRLTYYIYPGIINRTRTDSPRRNRVGGLAPKNWPPRS